MQYALSNLMMYATQTLYMPLMPISFQIGTAKHAGYDGLEWFPLRFPFGYGRMSEEDKKSILALHQSYLGELSLREAIRNNKRNPAALPSFLLMQHRYQSMTYIAKYERRVFRDSLPVVIYPPEKFEYGQFPQRFQLVKRLVETWKFEDVKEMLDWADKQNLRFVFDTNHSRDIGLGDWTNVIAQSIHMIDEIHVRSGHYTFDLNPEQISSSHKETADIFFGDFKSELADILKTFRGLGWQGLVTVEIPLADLLYINDINSRLISPSMFVKLHTALLSQIKQLIEG